jgi:hypothetical protein
MLRIITFLIYLCWEINNFVIKSDIFRRFFICKNILKKLSIYRVTMTTTLDISCSEIQWFCQQGEGFCMHVFSSIALRSLPVFSHLILQKGNWYSDDQWCKMLEFIAKWLKNRKFRKAILSAFYNISQRNFGILLILWCSFKLWWNCCRGVYLDQNFTHKVKGLFRGKMSGKSYVGEIVKRWISAAEVWPEVTVTTE